MVFKLIALSGPLKGRRLEIEEGVLSLGRDARCSMAIEEEGVAGEHAVIERKGDTLHLRDLGSPGGTRVNDEAVENARLKHGDVIEIGATRLFVESVRPSRAGGYGLWMVNQVLLVIALIAAPIAFVCLVAYLEQTYLGLGGVTLGPAPAAATNLPAAEARESGVAKEGGPGEFNLSGVGTSNAAPAPDGRGATAANSQKTDLAKEKDVIPTAAPASRDRGLSAAAVQDALQIEDPAKQPVAKALGIVSVEESKFADSQEVEEMRTLEICLEAAPSARTLTPESVQVDVLLFDRRAKTGDILLTHAMVSKGPLKPEGIWRADERKTMKVTYVAPKELRGDETTSGRAEQYFGYVVRIYYHGRLQDERARPTTLLHYSVDAANRGEVSGSEIGHRLLPPVKGSDGPGEAGRYER